MNTNTKKAIILLADGFEEIEAVIPVDLLRRAGVIVDLVTISEDSPVVMGSRNIPIIANCNFSNIDTKADAIIIPGGMPGSKNLAKEPKVIQLIKDFYTNNKLICAICAAPAIVLAPTGILEGNKFTCYPQMDQEIDSSILAKATYVSDQNCVISKNIITSKGPGTAKDFAITIITELCGKEIATKVATGALMN